MQDNSDKLDGRVPEIAISSVVRHCSIPFASGLPDNPS